MYRSATSRGVVCMGLFERLRRTAVLGYGCELEWIYLSLLVRRFLFVPFEVVRTKTAVLPFFSTAVYTAHFHHDVHTCVLGMQLTKAQGKAQGGYVNHRKFHKNEEAPPGMCIST